MKGYKCPYCSSVISRRADLHSTVLLDKDEYADVNNMDEFNRFKNKYLSITVVTCPECENYFVLAEGHNGFCENKVFNIYPDAVCRKFPDYVPLAIRADFEEAHRIKDLSPKAAATLARRCLQGMIRDHWKITKNNLATEISNLKGKLPEIQWNAIDALRKIGNIGAHMEADVNLIIDVDSNEAEKLLMLIEFLIEQWYVADYEQKKLLEEIAELGAEKTASK